MKNRISEYERTQPSESSSPKEKIQEIAAQSGGVAEKVQKFVERQIIAYPALSLGIGLTAGVLLGCMIKRK